MGSDGCISSRKIGRRREGYNQKKRNILIDSQIDPDNVKDGTVSDKRQMERSMPIMWRITTISNDHKNKNKQRMEDFL